MRISRSSMRGLFVMAVATVFLVTVTGRLFAWNLVCGISFNVVDPGLRSQKWTSDSEALNGVGHFYLGIAHLQNVEVEYISDLTKRAVEVAKIDKAKDELEQASKHLSMAIDAGEKLAAKAGNEDAKALSELSLRRYKALQQHIDSFVKAIEGRTLPELDKVHAALDLVIQITAFGRDVSLSHVGMHGHSLGGHHVKW
jgi:hypothetical protein